MTSERTLSGRGVRFVVTGILVNATLFAVLWLLLRTGVDYRIAVTIVYFIGMVWGYLQNRLWSWQSPAPWAGSFSRYILSYVGVYILHMCLVWFFVEHLGMGPLVATLVSVCFLIVPLFAILDRVVYRETSK